MWLRSAKPPRYFEALRKISKSPWPLQSCPFSDAPYKKSKLAPLQERKMIDRFRLWAKGGDGGNGCSSFHRSRHDRRGIPDGGNGGRGGNVILECSPTVWDFSSLQHHINAKRGGHGASKNKIGSRGSDKVVHVPVGTVLHVVEGEVPSVVEKTSSTALDPWDIPGTLDVDLSDPAQQSTSTNAREPEVVETIKINDGLSSCIGKNVVQSESTSLIESIPQSSHSGKKPRGCRESFKSWKEESAIEWKALETDGDVSEAEWEEEMEENECIQYDVAELTEPGQQIIVARGGEGGLGNVSHAKGSKSHLMKREVQRDDDFNLEASDDDEHSLGVGLPGSEVLLVLELKSIADVGLVGIPNAGKSTLLGAISRAKPRVGHYAFTTLRPNLGNLNYDDFSVTVADIPGIIRGAHENRGLGHAFLRHIERTKVLAYVLDLAAALDGRKGIPPWEQLKDLILELEFYREGLSDRPSLVVANKIDEAGADEVYEELKRRVPGVPIFPVCAVLEEGIPDLKAGLRMLVNGGESYQLNLDGIILD
ncbi:hypothetical protein F0562_021941 [Nyssa sinensis]|uniref:OBG-type G domain-containing protein n=1 Tax=Nyssa sinensis TaxID=561372 RepID=A0A5J5BQ85_9ASTE|nr:hypothetical protein F0562_021941 [Nyssa sinensis]